MRCKLVRDKCDAVEEGQCKPVQSEAEYQMSLVLKLHEEAQEIAADPSDPAEYADLLEVLLALAAIHDLSFTEIMTSFNAKREKLGVFTEGQIWTEVTL